MQYSSTVWISNESVWNNRKNGLNVTLGTVTMNKSYSYIVLNASSSVFTAVNSDSNNPGTLNFFPGGDITITNGNSKKVSSDIGYVYGAFLAITISGTSVTATGGFSSAIQNSGLTCLITCQLVFKAYMN